MAKTIEAGHQRWHRARGSLAPLRRHPQVLTVLAEGDFAFTARGRARIVQETMTRALDYAAVAIEVEHIDDHPQAAFVVESGIGRRWIDESEKLGRPSAGRGVRGGRTRYLGCQRRGCLADLASFDPIKAPNPLFLVGGVAAEEAQQELELLVAVGGEGGGTLVVGAVDLRGHLAELGRHLDKDAAAVLRVPGSAREASLFEPVEQSGHRARTQPRSLGEPAGRHRAFLIEDVEAAEGGAVEAGEVGDRVVEGVDRGLRGADRRDHLFNQFSLRMF